MPFDVMGVIEREVRRPVARFGEFKDGPEKRRILCRRFQRGHLDFRALDQSSFRWQYHHAILDCAFVAHVNCLTENTRQRKHLHDGMRVLPLNLTSRGRLSSW